MRAWQRMLSGRRLDLLNPSPVDIEIEDIAHGLARVARWNGQTVGDNIFSVAQHCLLVENLMQQLGRETSMLWSLAALLHDAPEYVIGDMISPFKNALNTHASGQVYSTFEDKLTQAIHIRFGLPALNEPNLHKRIKEADKAAAWFEATQLAGFNNNEALRYFGPKPDVREPLLVPLPAIEAKNKYLERFNQIFYRLDI